MKRWPLETGVCMLILLVGSTSFLCGCGDNDLSKIHAISSRIASNQIDNSYGVKIIYSDSARTKAVMTTPHLIQYNTEKTYQEMPEGLHIDFFSPDGKIESTLDAKYGIRYAYKELVMVQNDVRVVNQKGEILTTEQLFWDEKKKKIFTEKYVNYKKSDGTYEGDGMDADEKFTHVTWHKFRGMMRGMMPGANDSTSH